MTKIQRPAGVDRVVASSTRGAPLPKGADVALRSVALLDAPSGETRGKPSRAVAAALAGLLVVGSTYPAFADTPVAPRPQTAAWFEAAPPTGPPGVQRALQFPSVAMERPAASQEAQAATKTAIDAFHARLAVILRQDAGSLAQGLRPVQPGESLSSRQQKDLERAARDLVGSLPLGAFSPGVQSRVEAALGMLGKNVDLTHTTVKDASKLAGNAAGDLAGRIVDDLRAEHPGAFWSLATATATAIAAVGYTEGTDALEKLGIKPEMSTALSRNVKLRIGVRAGPEFSDVRSTVGLSGEHTFASGTVVRGGLRAELAGKNLDGATVSGSIATPRGFRADGLVRLDGSGRPFDARLSASQEFTHSIGGGGTGVVWAQGQWSDGTYGTVDGTTLSLGVSGTHGRWTSSLSGSYESASSTTGASLSMGRTFDIAKPQDLDVQIRGTVNNHGDGYIGIGATFRF
jgi:hypothetical protein